MKKIFTLFAAVMAMMSLSAENYFLKSNWGGAEASWKQMTMDEEDWYSIDNTVFDGKDFAINTKADDEGARVIKAANVNGSINTDAAELSAGDSVLFIFRPSLVSQYNEKESGLYAMIYCKNGYAIRGTWGEKAASWKNMPKFDEESFYLDSVLFDGQNVQVITGKELYNIKPANIIAMMKADYSDATLEAGDVVLFSFTPDTRSAYDETKSGLMALIIKKHGYALQSFFGGNELSWKEMKDDGDSKWSTVNTVFDGHNLAINNFASNLGARTIKPENVKGYIDNEFAELAAGDSVIFIYDPETYASMDPKQSGLSAMITKKNGYAIKRGGEGKNFIQDTEDEDWWVIENVLFNGKAVQIAAGTEIIKIAPENIQAYINMDEAELSAGDSVTFIFRPSLVNAYNPKESGLYAHITKKNGYAIRGTWGEKAASWKNMVKFDEESFVLDSVMFDGQNIQFASEEGIRVIKVENIKAMLADYTADAELEAGDFVLFSYTPDTYSHYDETKSGMMALIYDKHGYALRSNFGEGTTWAPMVQKDSDTYIIEGVLFNGMDVEINNFPGDLGARVIKVENIKAYTIPGYEEAELEAGDSIVFMYTPSEYNRYNEKESGLNALIIKKHGYALKSDFGNGLEWQPMVQKDSDTYIIENIVFDGKDVLINNYATDFNARVIKVANIKAYLLPTYDEAKLEEGDVITFMYTPSEYNRYDETQPGLFALIIEKKNQEGLEELSVEGKAVKVMMDGQLYIVKNGKIYNAAGTLVK